MGILGLFLSKRDETSLLLCRSRSLGLQNEHADHAGDDQHDASSKADICAQRMMPAGEEDAADDQSDNTKADNCIENHWILHKGYLIL